MFRNLPAAVSVLLLAQIPTSALAAQRSINFPAATLTANSTATNNGFSLILPAAGETGGFVSFVLPRDYKAGTVVRLRLSMFTNTAGPCTIYMFPRQASRMRAGKPIYNNTEKFTIVGGPTVSSPAQFTALSKTFELRAPLGATFTGQLPGDGITLEPGRDGDQATDTCGNLFISHAEIRYTRK